MILALILSSMLILSKVHGKKAIMFHSSIIESVREKIFWYCVPSICGYVLLIILIISKGKLKFLV
jgi:hypothetical protein